MNCLDCWVLNIKNNPSRVLGLDCSTKSVAFALFENKKLVRFGEILFEGKTTFQRLHDAQNKVRAVGNLLASDLICIEGATYVQNKKTVILLAYCFGSILGALPQDGVEVREVTPTSWQSKIGNGRLNDVEKGKIVSENPGKSDNWYKNAYRAARKDKTKVWVKEKFGIDVANDNISDAIALASTQAGVI